MPKHQTSRKTKDRLQKLKRVNRQEDVPECLSLEDFSSNEENLSEALDIRNNDLIKPDSDESHSVIFSDGHAQPADFHSFVDASENQSLSKIAYVGGEILSKLILFTLNMLRYLINHPTPVAILVGLISAYFIIMYLELSIATFIEMSMQFMWPTAHILLRGAERLFKMCGNFLAQVDDLGQAVYCDLAHVWCRRFNLMCEDQCSFVEMVVDRMRV